MTDAKSYPVTFNGGPAVTVREEMTVLEAARLAGVFIDTPCDGNGTCGKCRVKIEGKARLACRTTVTHPLTVELPPRPAATAPVSAMKIDKSTPGSYGIALDLGTTNMVASLVDLGTGHEIGSNACLNPQVAFGHDVITRISHATRTPGGVRKLQQVVIDALNGLIDTLCTASGVDAGHIAGVTVAANTTMLHLFAGVDPSPLGVAPYKPVFTESRRVSAAELGIRISPKGEAYLLPSASGFIGSDITAGILASRFHLKTGRAMFIDRGTNGELAAIADGELVACSTAAGPAFEGMNISCGCRAAPGAVDKVTIGKTGNIEIHTIDNAPPIGICGSGLIDLVAVLLQTGLIKPSGRFVSTKEAVTLPPPVRDRMTGEGKERRFIIAEGDSGNALCLTQTDVRHLQLGKAAVWSGLSMMMEALHLKDGDMDEVYLAGAFGHHLSPASLARIGLIPPIWTRRVVFVGNTSLSGARQALLSSEIRREVDELARRIRVLDLNERPDFGQRFVDSTAFPGS